MFQPQGNMNQQDPFGGQGMQQQQQFQQNTAQMFPGMQQQPYMQGQ